MSSLLLKSLLVAGSLLAGAQVASADELSNIANQLELVSKQTDLAAKQRDLATYQAAIAASQKSMANDQLAAVQADIAKAAALRMSTPMYMVSGTLTVLSDTSRNCNGLPFLRWQCNGLVKCDFTVNADICGLPGLATEPMELALQYKCGNTTIKDVFPFGRPAKLTCN